MSEVRNAAIAALAGRLDDADTSVRGAAAAVLIGLGAMPERVLSGEATPPAIIAWLDALVVTRTNDVRALGLTSHGEAAVRVAALRAAASLAPATALHAALAALSQDPSARVRCEAASLLPELPAPEEGDDPRPTALLSSLGDPAVREDALRSLTRLGWTPDSPGGVAALALARRDLKALTEVGEDAVPVLVGALRDRDADKDSVATRAFACEALGRIGAASGVAALDAALSDVGAPVRAAAARALAPMGALVPDSSRASLVARLRDDVSALVRRSAAATLGVLAEGTAVPTLRLSAKGDPDPSVRFAAGEALAHIGETAMLMESLKNPEAEVRRSAAVALGELKAEEAIDPLIGVLGDGTTSVRAAAFAALEAIGWVPVGVKRSPDDPRYGRWMTRSEQEARSGQVAGESVLEAQARLLEGDVASSDALVRQAALEALGRTRNPALGRVAEGRLPDDAPGVRRAAAEALEALGVTPSSSDGRARQLVALGRVAVAGALGRGAIPALLQALQGVPAPIRVDAVRALGGVFTSERAASPGAAIAPPEPDIETQPAGEPVDEAREETQLPPDPTPEGAQPNHEALQLSEEQASGDAAVEPAAPTPVHGSQVAVEPAVVESLLRTSVPDSAAEVRAAAIEVLAALAILDPAQAADAALEAADAALEDSALEVRTVAASALVALGAPGQRALLSRLESGSDGAREAAASVLADTLGATGDRVIVLDALIGRLGADPAPAVRVACAYALAAGRDAERACAPLQVTLERDLECEVRRAAALALGRLGDPGSRQALIQALGDSYAVVRDAALAALATFGWSPQGGVAVAMLALAAGDFKTLGGCGAAALPLLQQTLSERGLDRITIERRVRAVETVEAIVPGLEATDGEGPAVPLLRLALTDASWRVRRSAASAAQRLQVTALRDDLLDIGSRDESEAVRCAALRALGRVGHSGQVDALRGLASGDPSPEVRLAASQALAGPALGEIAPLLVALIALEPEVRRQAAEELGEVGNPRAIDPLLLTLGDATAAVRHAARASLSRLGWVPVGVRAHPGAAGYDRWVLRSELFPATDATPQQEVLEAAREHPDPRVREAVDEALRHRALEPG